MTLFIICIIVALIGVAAFWFGTGEPDRNSDGVAIARGLKVAGVLLVIGGGFGLFMNSFHIVPARNVGVPTTFGRVGTAADAGWLWVAPWTSVEDVDATVQNLNLDADTQNCPTVRLANQTTACIDVTLQWHIDQHGGTAGELWQRYRGTDNKVVEHVGRNVVQRELNRALGNAFATYNPLLILSDPTSKQPSTDDLSSLALNALRTAVDRGVIIDTLLISPGGVHYDEITQQKLNAYAQALADTQIATQQKLTAEQQRLANEKLASSTSTQNAGVQYQNCLNLIKELAAKNQLASLPPTFNCGSAGATPVIVGQK